MRWIKLTDSLVDKVSEIYHNLVPSYSFIKNLIRCDRYALLDQINKKVLRNISTNDMGLHGIFLHEVFKNANNFSVKNNIKKLSEEQTSEIYTDTLYNFNHTINYEDIESLYKHFYFMVKDFYFPKNILEIENDIYIDHNFEVCERKDAIFHGIVDLVYISDDVCQILDYKTGWKKESDVLQVILYALLISAKHKQIEMFGFKHFYTRMNYIDDHNGIVVGRDDLSRAKSFLNYYNHRKDMVFNTFLSGEVVSGRNCDNCKFCPYYKICYKDLVVPEQMDQVINYKYLEAVIKKEKQAIKELFNEHEELLYKSEKFIRKDRSSWKVKDSEKFALFIKSRLPEFANKAFNKSNLQKILKKLEGDQELYDYVESQIVSDKSWTFDAKSTISSIEEFREEIKRISEVQTEIYERFNQI